MAERKIPDRSDEPAVKESLDHEKSTTASNSNDVPADDQQEARDDEGNSIETQPKPGEAPARPRPDSDSASQ
jgi:hypothetical protein